MALSTENVKTTGGIPKTMQPGNGSAKLLKLTLNQPEFLKKDDGYFVVMEMVADKPTDDFEGFLINKDNPDGGRYEGPVGRIKSNKWPYKDGKTKSGVEISRDNEILKFIKIICEETDSTEWFKNANNKYNTIEEFVDAFNEDAPFADKKLEMCIAGRAYTGSENYVNYDLFLPKFSKMGVPFQKEGKTNNRLLVFNETEHIEIPTPTEVNSFPGEEASSDESAPFDTSETAVDSDMNPEFEL